MKFIERYQRDHQNKINRALHSIGIPMIVLALPFFYFHFYWGLGLFVVGWVLQFLGHWKEGKAPSFFADPRFLLVGVQWWFTKVVLRRPPDKRE